MKHQFFTGLLSLSLFTGISESGVPPKWADEPIMILGIPLGASIGDTIPECPVRKRGEVSSSAAFCKLTGSLGKEGMGYLDFDETPLPAILSTITAFAYDGVVGSMHAIAPHRSYQELKAAAIEGYGPPSLVSIATVKTNAGVEWTSEELEWVGQVVSVQLHERFERATISALIASHLPTLAAYAERDEADTSKAASQL
jgi:hypothetical protein